jgi:cyclophilin family peptidyl-prolyl cis-trans isomerase
MPNRKTRDRQLSKLAARRAAERRKKRRQRGITFGVAAAVAAIGLSILLVALLHNPKKATTAKASPTPSRSAAAVACGGSVPSSALVNKPTFTKPPKMTIDPKKTYTATLVTSCGPIQIQLFAKDAPIAVNNFVFLAKQHFYDGLTFHRIVKDFVIQGGDPKADGTGGPGYSFKDELNNDLKYETGTLAMANSGKDTNGSQFFIVTTDAGAKQLTKSYTIFGKVLTGMDVVTKIASTPTTSTSTQQDVPTQTVYILKVTISTS